MRRRQIDLQDIIITYIDLKYSQIWSNDFIKEVKWHFKEQDTYFRFVKQGSILAYMTFHVFTVLSIVLMAILRQSLIAFGYIIILIPNLHDAADILKQRLFEENKQANSIVIRI